MQFRKSKIKLIVLLTIVTAATFKAQSQTNSEILLYTKFDSIVGKENLGLNNGPLALNPYKTIGDNNMFFKNNKYTIGNLVYDGQPYFNVKLKYDIFKDQLILNPPEQPEHIGISLIQDKTDSFSIYGKNFVKITKSQTSLPEFISGYYELIKISKNFNLYIKHYKDILKEINEEGVYYSFHQKYQYFIEYNNKFYEINNKASIVKIFPENKKNINAFYQKNRSLSTTDYNQFINSLMISIYDSSINNSK
ncbi:hypothetical protein C8C85_0982 [Flavobacterium sp. 103]|uniref:hypothetical protein n=1 Tax=unclassified Flavobacterium TaxID=196869 RepID=UPI000D5C89CA|nr:MULTISPECIES: hypothetical protein [unclassified Flavobacterium]PVX45203.1 hypothetical protein C8C85_0982 [Flavobacterium sp. 103]